MVRPAFSMNAMPHFALCSRKRFSSHPRVHVATFLRAVDEDIYNRRFETRDVGVRAFLRGLNDRHPRDGVPPQFLGCISATAANTLAVAHSLLPPRASCSRSVPRQDSARAGPELQQDRLHVPVRSKVQRDERQLRQVRWQSLHVMRFLSRFFCTRELHEMICVVMGQMKMS